MTDRKKIIYEILSKLNDGNKDFTEVDFNIDNKLFYDIVKIIEIKGLANGFSCKEYISGDVLVDVEGAFITIDGIDYLKKNSTSGKIYKGLKEIKSWIPGM